MKKMIMVSCAALGTLCVSPAFADIYQGESHNVQQDSNGNFTASTRSDTVDANGNSIQQDTNVNADANGNAVVTKRTEADQNNDDGTSSKTITHRTTDTDGHDKVINYQERSN